MNVWRDLTDFLAVLTQPNRKIGLPNQINERENITRHCVRDREKGMLVPWQTSDRVPTAKNGSSTANVMFYFSFTWFSGPSVASLLLDISESTVVLSI